MSELPKLLPVSILITTYNRINLLAKTIELINERTFYPFRLFVIDNNSTDGTQGYLKAQKVYGKIFDHIFLPENVGQSKALNVGFEEIEKWEKGADRPTRPSSDWFVTSNDDIYPPMLGQENCWLTQMIELLERHEPEFGGLCMRTQRLARNDIDETKEIVECFKGFNSIFRLMRRSDIRQLGDEPFGRLLKWNSNTTADKYKLQLKKKFGFTTHIYADHAGFIKNKGYGEDVETFTVAENKKNEMNESPYPNIDPLTNEPIKINSPKDASEQKLRDDYHAILEGKHVGPEVTLIVLTCKRPQGLQRILDSIKKTTTDVPYKLIVVADNDDTDAYTYCIENGILCLLSSERRDFVAQANLAVYSCATPYFVILADDMSIEQQGWLTEALKVYKENFPNNDGLMSFDDGVQRGRLFATGMSSKKFFFEIGSHLYHPSFIHFGADNVTTFLAKQMGRYHYAESVKVIHHHPTNKNPELANPSDETYKNSEMYNHFDQQLKKIKKSDVEKLLKEKNYCDYL